MPAVGAEESRSLNNRQEAGKETGFGHSKEAWIHSEELTPPPQGGGPGAGGGPGGGGVHGRWAGLGAPRCRRGSAGRCLISAPAAMETQDADTQLSSCCGLHGDDGLPFAC